METHHSKLESQERDAFAAELQGHQLGAAAPSGSGLVGVDAEHSRHGLSKKRRQVTVPFRALGSLYSGKKQK